MPDLRSLVIALALASCCEQSGTGAHQQENSQMKTQTPPNPLFERIAREQLGIQTLAEQKRDHLDFHEVGVNGLHRALQAAFDAGRQADKAPA